MALSIKGNNNKALNEFVKEHRDRTLTFLGKCFHLCTEDCEDVFQEASITLYLSALDGVLDNLTSSLYTYFIGICKNKAFEKLRANKKHIALSLDSIFESGGDNVIVADRADKLLSIIEETDEPKIGVQQAVQDIVMQLPHPCNELLWAYYRDGLSMKAIASMYNYASENAAKVTKHRCMEKFRKQYKSMITTH